MMDIQVWKIDEPHPYPWRFSVTFRGKVWRFIGIPNMCATKHQACCRAHAKLRWMRKNLPTFPGYCKLCRAKEIQLYGTTVGVGPKHDEACRLAGCLHPTEYAENPLKEARYEKVLRR